MSSDKPLLAYSKSKYRRMQLCSPTSTTMPYKTEKDAMLIFLKFESFSIFFS
jgi:hypothetical protein